MNGLPNWLYPADPELRGECRDVLLFGAMADDPDDPPIPGMSKKGLPLKRARNGDLPCPGSQARRCYDAVPIWPASVTSADVAPIAGVTSKQASSVLGQIADRENPLLRRVPVEKGELGRWTRDR